MEYEQIERCNYTYLVFFLLNTMYLLHFGPIDTQNKYEYIQFFWFIKYFDFVWHM